MEVYTAFTELIL